MSRPNNPKDPIDGKAKKIEDQVAEIKISEDEVKDGAATATKIGLKNLPSSVTSHMLKFAQDQIKDVRYFAKASRETLKDTQEYLRTDQQTVIAPSNLGQFSGSNDFEKFQNFLSKYFLEFKDSKDDEKTGDLYYLELPKILTRIKKINLHNCDWLTDKLLAKILPIFPNLEAIQISECDGLKTPQFNNLVNPRKLKSLNFSGCRFPIQQTLPKILLQCPNLESLNLFRCNLMQLEVLPNLENLKSLNLSRTQGLRDNILLGILLKCQNLESLDLSNPGAFADGAVNNLPALNKLKSLNLAEYKKLTDAGLQNIFEKCPSLESLDLAECSRLKTPNLAALPSLEKLKSLNLAQCRSLTNEGLHNILEKCPNLAGFLNLAVCETLATPKLADLPSLAKVKFLNLYGCHSLTDEGLKNILEKCPNLETLRLRKCEELENPNLRNLPNLEKLKSLDLGDCENLTKIGMKNILLKCPNLESLKHDSSRNSKTLEGEELAKFKAEILSIEEEKEDVDRPPASSPSAAIIATRRKREQADQSSRSCS